MALEELGFSPRRGLVQRLEWRAARVSLNLEAAVAATSASRP